MEYHKVAEIHIERAIKLYFIERDYFSATTLAHAAHTLLEGMIKKLNEETGSAIKSALKVVQDTPGGENFDFHFLPNAFKHYKEESYEIEHNIKSAAENALHLSIMNFSIFTEGNITSSMIDFENLFMSASSSVISVPSVVKSLSSEDLNTLSGKVVDCAIQLHKKLGPGLLESAYQQGMAYMLTNAKIPFEKEKTIPVKLDDVLIEAGYRADFIVDGKIIIEMKSVASLAPIHEAQLLTYMKLGNFPLGLLFNFNEKLLKDGIKRMRL